MTQSLFDKDYKLIIEVVNDLINELIFETDFLKSESLKIKNEINRIDNLSQKEFLTNLLGNL